MSLRSYLEETERIVGKRLVSVRREINQLRAGGVNSARQYLKWFRDNYGIFSQHILPVSFEVGGRTIHTDLTNFATIVSEGSHRIIAHVRLPISLYPSGYTNAIGKVDYWIPLYRSSGRNSKMGGSWFPALGIMRCPNMVTPKENIEYLRRYSDKILKKQPRLSQFMGKVLTGSEDFNSHTWIIKCDGLQMFDRFQLHISDHDSNILKRAFESTYQSLFPKQPTSSVRGRRLHYTCGQDFFEGLSGYMKEHTSIRRVDTNSLPNFSAEVKEGDTFVFQHGNHRIPHRAYDISVHGGDELFAFNMSTHNAFGVSLWNDFPDEDIQMLSDAMRDLDSNTADIFMEAIYLRSPQQIAQEVLRKMITPPVVEEESICQVCEKKPSLHGTFYCQTCWNEL